eukprot:m.32117 g.32117  ORF g.32117 m.32117 type:complete len:167 (-) comp42211_c0_seq5:73-573(-)
MSALDLARKAGHSRIAVLLGEHQHRLACAAAGPGIHAKRALHDPTLSVSQAAETEAPDLRSGEMVQPLGSKDCTMERDEDLALSLATEVSQSVCNELNVAFACVPAAFLSAFIFQQLVGALTGRGRARSPGRCAAITHEESRSTSRSDIGFQSFSSHGFKFEYSRF